MESYPNSPKLISQLLDCAYQAEHCAKEALATHPTQEALAQVGLCKDTADICWMGVRLLERSTPLLAHYLSLCVNACAMASQEPNYLPEEACRKYREACVLCAEGMP